MHVNIARKFKRININELKRNLYADEPLVQYENKAMSMQIKDLYMGRCHHPK